jgi:hypothetical protein
VFTLIVGLTIDYEHEQVLMLDVWFARTDFESFGRLVIRRE